MLFFSKHLELKDALVRNTALAEDVKRLQDTISRMTAENQDAKLKDVATSTFAIDFNKMRVCALERNMHNGMVCTIIGHLIAEPVGDTGKFKEHVKEYYFYCSQEQHEKLIKEFEAHKKSTK